MGGSLGEELGEDVGDGWGEKETLLWGGVELVGLTGVVKLFVLRRKFNFPFQKKKSKKRIFKIKSFKMKR
jgi:hypothetical protein